MSDERLLIKVTEAAALLGISRSKAYQMAKSGELPGVMRVGGTIRIHRRGFYEYIERLAGRDWSDGPR